MQNNKPKPRDETHISLRVTKKQREKIDAAAKRCGILPSEYIRQRALGYAPKQMLPDAFFVCCEHLDRLQYPPYSAAVNAAALEVVNQLNVILQRAIKGLDREDTEWQRPDSGP